MALLRLNAMRKFTANVKHHIYACIYTDVNIFTVYANIYNTFTAYVKGANIFAYIFTPRLQSE